MDARPSTATSAALSAWAGADEEDCAALDDEGGALEGGAAMEDVNAATLEEPGPLCGVLEEPDGPMDEEPDAP
jgi:hypothetical protein